MITVTLAVVCYSTAASSYDDRVVLVSLGVADDPAPPPPPRDASGRAVSVAAGAATHAAFVIATEWEGDEEVAHLHAEANAGIQEAPDLNTLLQAGAGVEADAVASAAHPLLVVTHPDVVQVARRVVARWRAFVAERKGVLLLRLLHELPEVFFEEVLRRLASTDRTMLAQVGRPWLAAVLASELPRLPNGVTVQLRLRDICTSVERLAWAKANGCHWGAPDWFGSDNPCAHAAAGGHLQVLQWARAHHCPWNEKTSHAAAVGGHLEVLQWARAHGCPWSPATCELAAQFGPFQVLRWAREHGCEWDAQTCAQAAAGGHLHILQWAREHHCPWVSWTCSEAAGGGHLQVLRWARENHCPWDGHTREAAAFGGHPEVMQWLEQHGCPDVEGVDDTTTIGGSSGDWSNSEEEEEDEDEEEEDEDEDEDEEEDED